MKKFSKILFLLLVYTTVTAQNINYATLLIPEILKENANSTVRNQSIIVTITSQKSMSVSTLKVVTVFNKYGLNNIDAIEYYDKSRKVKSIEATIYNSFGKEIKKIKRKDFLDQSVADGFSIYSDDRKIFLDYTPIEYPFTVVYESEIETSTTAFVTPWYPIDDLFESVQNSNITIYYPPSLGFKYKENNFENRTINKTKNDNSIIFSVDNLPAEKNEENMPSYQEIVPFVLFALEKFNLEGVEGNAKTWKEYGEWMYTNLLKDTEELPEETKNKMKLLVANETDNLKKAQLIYQYVQDKTRYVSIQLGIGGWKPMLAKDVDKLGYGDCKALSNYTRVLLKSVGIDSFYTVIYGDNYKKGIDQDFVSMQGNHVILTIPNNNKNYFLECTSQVKPFGFEGDFTDDRNALVIKPTGGEIVKTSQLNNKINSQLSKGNYTLTNEGTINCTLEIKSKGIQYDNIYEIEGKSSDVIDKHYKSHFSWINNLKLEKSKFLNNKQNVEFTENISFSALNYATANSGMILLPINVFNQSNAIPQRIRNRKNAFEISRGFYDEDEFEVLIPSEYSINAKPENIIINEKFGSYKAEITIINESKILYKRSFLLNNGKYDKTEYENYRKFREQIAKADNCKIVLTKKF